VDAHVWPDLQNTLEVEDDALGTLGLQNKVSEDTLEPPDLQNTLEVGDDALDALGALVLQNKVGGLGEDVLEIFTCRTILRSGMMPIPDLQLNKVALVDALEILTCRTRSVSVWMPVALFTCRTILISAWMPSRSSPVEHP
jgi:hypothetical protein